MNRKLELVKSLRVSIDFLKLCISYYMLAIHESILSFLFTKSIQKFIHFSIETVILSDFGHCGRYKIDHLNKHIIVFRASNVPN